MPKKNKKRCNLEKIIFISVIVLIVLLIVFFFHKRHLDKAHHYRHKVTHKHGESFSIDFYAYNSKIRHWNAAYKVILSVFTLIFCIAFDNPFVSIVIIIGMLYLTIVKGKLPINDYLPIFFVQIGFIFLSTFTIAIDFSKSPTGQYNLHLWLFYVFTSYEKLKTTAFLILKVFAAISSLQMMILSTPSSEIIHVLRKIHVPKLIIELMNIIYRYIFILIDIYVKMKNSAEARHGYCDFKTSCHTFGSITSNMLIVSFKKANAYYDAMEARCYEGELMFLEEDKNISWMQIVMAATFLTSLIIIWLLTKNI